ncbi:MAG: hypothetical protein IJO83_00225 [Clostridia bacterium]|nr:hypothetical protein [Clostridia bacterium]
MKKTLVLFTTDDAYYFGRIKSENLYVDGLFKDCNSVEKFVLKVLRKLSLPFTKWFYRSWYKKLNGFDKIVVFDTPFHSDLKLLDNIAKKAPNIEKYFYSWNTILNEARYAKEREAADRNGFKFFCYDHGSCEKYDLNFNTIMYDNSLQLSSIEKVEYDALFLGYLKDRKQKILELYNLLKDASLNPRFIIVSSNPEDESLPFEFRTGYVNYYDYLKMLENSGSILDIAQKGQDGFSMRVMEAIFFNKKLISSNVALYGADFYNPNNILIIDSDNVDCNEIKEFFEKPFVPYSEATRKYYSIEAWADRFIL